MIDMTRAYDCPRNLWFTPRRKPEPAANCAILRLVASSMGSGSYSRDVQRDAGSLLRRLVQEAKMCSEIISTSFRRSLSNGECGKSACSLSRQGKGFSPPPLRRREGTWALTW